MKKNTFFLLFLCLCLLIEPLALTVSADETEVSTETTAGVTESVPQATEAAFGTVCVSQGCRTIEGMTPLAGSDRKVDTAQAAFLYEVNTGTVVYSLNPDTKMAPGSLVKLVNVCVALQTCSMEDQVTLTSDVYRLPSGSSHSGLKPEEVVTVSDLAYCMLLYTGNDAAIGLAIAASGTQQAHVTKMNQWAESIGCTNTNFTNVHGLDSSECVTTARDMAKIYLAAIENETVRTILEATSYTKPATNKNEKFSFRTTNYMSDNGIIQQFYDDRVKGGVASYNPVYGASLVIHAESGDKKYIGVILNATRVTVENKSWIVTTYGNYEEMTNLVKLGFNSFKNKRILYQGQALSQFTVAGGECDVVGMCVEDVDSMVPAAAQMDNLVMNFKIVDGNLTAPIQKGEFIATMQIEYRGSVMAETEVYAMNNVKRADGNGVTIYSVASGSQGGGGAGFFSVLGTICVIGLGIAVVYLAFNAYMRNRIRARRRKRRAERRRNR